MTATDPNAFLMQSGAKSFKFATVGTVAKGSIVSLELQQQRDLDGVPKWWDDAKAQPMMQVRIVLQTDERDPEITDDDGQRAVYAKGNMQQAIRDAVKAAGASEISEGGVLAVQYTGDGTASKKGQNPPKQYRAEYKAPSSTPTSISADALI